MRFQKIECFKDKFFVAVLVCLKGPPGGCTYSCDPSQSLYLCTFRKKTRLKAMK